MKMDPLSLIKQPIEQEFSEFTELFSQTLTHGDHLLAEVLSHIRQRGGKRMRPILTLLIAKNYGGVTMATQHAAIGLELLHTASLVHDDVVDESEERRGQASVNATYNNKVAVLTGDFILSTALLNVSYTNNQRIIENLAQLGRTLASGELLQLWNISNKDISEDIYYDVIKQKTAVLFESCAAIGALSAGATDDDVAQAARFGQNLGIMFQIRDDIFDYYDSKEIGKPTGNDMDESMMNLARKVKAGTINTDEIAVLVEFTKQHGGIDYAEKRMEDFHREALKYLEESVKDDAIRVSLSAYLDYVIQRKK